MQGQLASDRLHFPPLRTLHKRTYNLVMAQAVKNLITRMKQILLHYHADS